MYRRIGKRLFDIALVFPIMVIVIPPLIVIALLIRIESKGPVFFIQERVGLYGKTFQVYKFRTMTDKPRISTGEILRGNSEVTAVGHWLRRFKIDELPQLVNVLKGDMSLVGPRPGLVKQLEEYDENGLMRLQVRPGLTGLAQVRGNIHLSWPERWQYDAQYVQTVSAVNDVKIILQTIGVLIFGEDKFVKSPNVQQID